MSLNPSAALFATINGTNTASHHSHAFYLPNNTSRSGPSLFSSYFPIAPPGIEP
jgi:hypothetical protein